MPVFLAVTAAPNWAGDYAKALVSEMGGDVSFHSQPVAARPSGFILILILTQMLLLTGRRAACGRRKRLALCRTECLPPLLLTGSAPGDTPVEGGLQPTFSRAAVSALRYYDFERSGDLPNRSPLLYGSV
ncbi:hypothetical protein KCP75_15495 [Salmonella enterica subsp. enterica]|nr:hypothetical protein KCP75_15495 [Salmonella enterica subsp. enterica]